MASPSQFVLPDQEIAASSLVLADRVFRLGVIAAVVWYLSTYVVVAAIRLPFPFDLEWLEGAGLEHVRRIVLGQPVYARPSLEFIALPYTPLYYYICAIAARATGHIDFVPMRLISMLASIASFVLIVLIIRRETRRWYPAFVGCGLLAATYDLLYGWFDLGRVDSFFLAMVLGAVYALQRGTRTSFAAAGIMFALSFLVKQTGLLIALPLLAWSAIYDWRRSLVAILPAASLVIATTLYFQITTGGWYWYYVVHVQRLAGFFVTQRIVTFWTMDLANLAGAVLLAALYAFHVARHRSSRSAATVCAAVAAMILASWASRLRTQNVVNVLMPAFAGVAILSGLAVAKFAGFENARGQPTRRTVLVHAVCLLQFIALAFNPIDRVPSALDRLNGIELTRRIAAFEGDVFVPCHGYLAARVGKPSYAHLMELWDVEWDPVQSEALGTQLRASFERQQFSAIFPCGYFIVQILDRAGMSTYYAKQDEFLAAHSPEPLTNAGLAMRTESVYVPRRR
jgi:hypothetical protein